MSTLRELRLHLLITADAPQPTPINPNELAARFGLDSAHVCDELVNLFEQKYLMLSAWDGNCHKPFDRWPSADQFFGSALGAGTKFIKLRSKGKEWLDDFKSEQAVQANLTQ